MGTKARVVDALRMTNGGVGTKPGVSFAVGDGSAALSADEGVLSLTSNLGGFEIQLVPLDGSIVATDLYLNGTTLKVATKTPASAAAIGLVGQIAWDTSYIYVCVANNTWKRAALATW